MKKLLAILLLLACPWPALAQSNPGFTTGQIPTATQWNSYFTGKADYSEGSWTPVGAGSTMAGTLTYSTQVGRYIRIGNMVTVWGTISWSATDGAQTGNAAITGLPFTSSNISNVFFVGAVIANANNILVGTTPAIRLVANASKMRVWDNSTAQAVPATLFTGNATGSLAFSLTYRIN